MEYIINFLREDFKGIWYILYLVFAMVSITKLIKVIIKNLDVELESNNEFMGSKDEVYEADVVNRHNRENVSKTTEKHQTLVIKE